MTSEHDREESVRDAVIAFVEAGESPDRHRLALIEQRLLADRRRRAAPWWWIVLGIGLASGAAAAYWAVSRDEAIEPAPVHEDQSAVEENGTAATDGAEGSANGNGREESGPEKESPVIYIGQ